MKWENIEINKFISEHEANSVRFGYSQLLRKDVMAMAELLIDKTSDMDIPKILKIRITMEEDISPGELDEL